MNVCLANIDYRRHMTTEGDQFQEGLAAAGWTLAGAGYDGLRDVPAILDRYRPARVVVHDKRDWDPDSRISFRKDIGFEQLSALQAFRGVTAVVVKDAATSVDYQHAFYQEAGAHAAIVYYHPESVRRHAAWLAQVPLVRTYHTLDAAALAPLDLRSPRRGAVVSGAVSGSYPFRTRIVREARTLGVDVLRHPGYGNRGAHTPEYLQTLSGYRVSLATASAFGFALRKIIESVAMGCTVITDLPAYDVLPEIDGALVRVSPSMPTRELRELIADVAQAWDPEARAAWAAKARAYYDYRATGARLDADLRQMAKVAA